MYAYALFENFLLPSFSARQPASFPSFYVSFLSYAVSSTFSIEIDGQMDSRLRYRMNPLRVLFWLNPLTQTPTQSLQIWSDNWIWYHILSFSMPNSGHFWPEHRSNLILDGDDYSECHSVRFLQYEYYSVMITIVKSYDKENWYVTLVLLIAD